MTTTYFDVAEHRFAVSGEERILAMMDKKYQSGLSIKELCKIYIDAYYQAEPEDVD